MEVRDEGAKPTAMKLATWNVNSIRARLPRVLAWLDANTPDVLCLQEIKVEDAQFPTEDFVARGYHVVLFGQRTYNGVAIAARSEPADVVRGLADGADDPQARLLATTLDGVRVLSAYFPNGEAMGSSKFAYKLDWMARLRARLTEEIRDGRPLALCGDFNVAPAALDVHDPTAWDGHVLCTSEERAALDAVRDTGLVDLVRQLNPDTPCFTWWDYRQLGFPKNRGLRIDHVFVTPALAARATAAGVDRSARKGKLPSDHAPVWAEFR